MLTEPQFQGLVKTAVDKAVSEAIKDVRADDQKAYTAQGRRLEDAEFQRNTVIVVLVAVGGAFVGDLIFRK